MDNFIIIIMIKIRRVILELVKPIEKQTIII
jgi:hypothetical protein